MRLFIALPIPENTKAPLIAAQQEFRKTHVGASWVKPDNMHITLAFLGETDAAYIPILCENIKRSTHTSKSFELYFHSFGFFPTANRPRVLFAQAHANQTLTTVWERLALALGRLGYAKENRFNVHVTLARIKNAAQNNALIAAVQQYPLDLRCTIEKVALFKSLLLREGPRYEEIFSSNLTA